MAGELQDKIAVITAAASGMGRETSLRFAEEGAHVVSVDIDVEAGAALLDDVKAAGGSAEFLAADLTDLGQIEDVAKAIEAAHGHVDVLFNHAGAAGPRGFDFDADQWEFQVNLNLRAPVFLTKLLLPLMGAGGSVIFTSSVSGLIASRNSPVYSTVKSGVLGFMRAIAAVGGADGIRANAICPGTVDTPMLKQFFQAPGESDTVLEERLASFKQAVPLGRISQPQEIAELVLFLAGERSSFITGVAVPIDGGYVAL
ncbi:MAG: SDR family oxidoreductase [Solirubrobacterales bacterium]|nr:SDR family oxidoreductase [Solirubrobacterales bacterium]